MEERETLKKSGMCAREGQALLSLVQPRQFFLDCRIEEEKESVTFLYEIQDRKRFSDLRQERIINRLRALLEIPILRGSFGEIRFTLHPDNLYYDRNFRPYIRKRDLYDRGAWGEKEEFLRQYKALIGHVMQRRYSFDDYITGGEDLYHKNPFLKRVAMARDIEELTTLLRNEYEVQEEMTLHRKVEVGKTWYRLNTGCIIAAGALILLAAAYISYMLFSQIPGKNARIYAAEHYLEGNYVKVIDDLQGISPGYLDKYMKYILAVSYVRGESLTQEQKDNILETLRIDGEEKLKEYWIYLGRLDTVEAQNIAMQRSDNELLLYAYMTEKAVLEKNTEITGEEKADRLSELEDKIEELAKQYEDTTDTR